MGQVDQIEATRDRLLRLAGGLFATRGYDGVSMRDVALAGGVTKPALYYHFRDKDALFTECLLLQQMELGRRLSAATASGGTLADRVAAVASVLLATASEHPARARTDAAGNLPPEARARVDASYADNVMSPLVRLFDVLGDTSGLRHGVSPSVAAAALVGVCTGVLPDLLGASRAEAAGIAAHGAATTPASNGSGDLPRVVADLVLHGVAP